jgi:hypothetical protein
MSAQYRRTNMRRSVLVLKENERAKLDYDAIDKGMGRLIKELLALINKHLGIFGDLAFCLGVILGILIPIILSIYGLYVFAHILPK